MAVHHLHIRNIFKKDIAEALACKEILQYVQDKKKYRHFFFSESNHEYNFLQPTRYTKTVNDLDIVNFMAAQICAANSDIKHVVIGTTKSDVASDSKYSAKLERSQRILLECLSLESDDLDLGIEYPFEEYTLQQTYDVLPAGLKGSTFSCLSPIYTDTYTAATPCGRCAKCQLRKLLKTK